MARLVQVSNRQRNYGVMRPKPRGLRNESSAFDQFQARRDRMFLDPRLLRSTFASTLPVIALFASLAMPALAAGSKTITAVMHSDLRVTDPIITTAYITRDHGYMVYDTLLATDSNFKIQPQMADWKVSDD